MNKIQTLLIIIAFLSGIFVMKFYFSAQETTCPAISQHQVIAKIKRDILEKRIQAWSLDVSSRNEEIISFNNKEIQVSQNDFLVPLEIHTVSKSLKYFAIYICKTGKIEYSRSE